MCRLGEDFRPSAQLLHLPPPLESASSLRRSGATNQMVAAAVQLAFAVLGWNGGLQRQTKYIAIRLNSNAKIPSCPGGNFCFVCLTASNMYFLYLSDRFKDHKKFNSKAL